VALTSVLVLLLAGCQTLGKLPIPNELSLLQLSSGYNNLSQDCSWAHTKQENANKVLSTKYLPSVWRPFSTLMQITVLLLPICVSNYLY
jgi:uncharacterized protein YceK